MAEQAWQSISNNRTIVTTLASLGALYTLNKVSGIAAFFYTHFLRRSSLQRYNTASDSKSPASWALITGASDGIGKGFAEELCNQGFNIILHGRNKTKLETVRQELLKQWPKREVKLLVFDVATEANDTEKLQALLSEFKSLDIRVLVNNIGGAGGLRPAYIPLHQRPASFQDLMHDLNLRFPTEITRQLLPSLIKHQPSLILNIGSMASDTRMPYAVVYSGSKSYNKAFAGSLGAELAAEGHRVEVKLVQTGMVSTGTEKRDVTLTVPSSRNFARQSLRKVGMREWLIYGYWWHEMQVGLFGMFPDIITDRVVVGIVKGERDIERRMLDGKEE